MALDSTLTQLETAQLVRRVGEEDATYMFKHALTQDAAYQSLLLKQRREIHHAVAESIAQIYPEQLDNYAALLAQHYAEAGDDAKTMEYSLQAAQAAVRLYAYPEARGHLLRALDALRRLPDTQDNRRRRVDAIFWYGEVAWGAFVPGELFGLVKEAEQLAGSLQNPDGTLGDARRLAQIHTRLTGLYLARGEYREAIHYARQGLAEASGLANKILIATPASQLGIALMAQGYFAEAVPYLVQAITPMEQATDRWEWFGTVGCLGTSLAMRGQVAEGLAEVQRALVRVEASQNGFGITQTRVFLLAVCLEQEDQSQLLVESERTVVVAYKSETAMFASLALGFKALAQSRLGQFQDALETMTASRATGARVGGQLMMSDWLAAANAEITFNAGKLEDAIRVAEQAVVMAQSYDGIFAEGWAQRVWGQALAAQNHFDAAIEHLACSLELFDLGGAVLEAARTRVAWGKVLRERGEVDAAREHFEKAATQFESSGLMRELEEARALLSTEKS